MEEKRQKKTQAVKTKNQYQKQAEAYRSVKGDVLT